MPKPNKDALSGNIWEKNDNGLLLPNTIIAERQDGVKKKRKTLREYMEWALQNISLVLLVPSFLGAVWQILELSSINIAYIRFFSISQIPIDGTLILFLIVLLTGLSKITASFVKFVIEGKVKLFKNEQWREEIRPKLTREIVIKTILCIVLILPTIGYFIPSIFREMFPTSPIIAICLIYFSIVGVIFYLADLMLYISVKISGDHPNSAAIEQYTRAFIQKHQNPIYWSIILSICIALFTLTVLLRLFSQNFILPTDLYNTKYLETIIYKEFETENYTVEYFNDKYIFVKLCPTAKCTHKLDNRIVIYPTEKVLFKTTYGKVWTGYLTAAEPINN